MSQTRGAMHNFVFANWVSFYCHQGVNCRFVPLASLEKLIKICHWVCALWQKHCARWEWHSECCGSLDVSRYQGFIQRGDPGIPPPPHLKILHKTLCEIWWISWVQSDSIIVDIWWSIDTDINTPITAHYCVLNDTVPLTAHFSLLHSRVQTNCNPRCKWKGSHNKYTGHKIKIFDAIFIH